MIIAFAGDLMTARCHALDQFREAIRNPSQDKESGFDVVPIQQVEHAVRRPIQSGVEAVPLSSGNNPIEGPDLEIILKSQW